MEKILIINGHPDTLSFNNALSLLDQYDYQKKSTDKMVEKVEILGLQNK